MRIALRNQLVFARRAPVAFPAERILMSPRWEGHTCSVLEVGRRPDTLASAGSLYGSLCLGRPNIKGMFAQSTISIPGKTSPFGGA